jgi:uncharacterized protein with GYD domain
MPKYLYKFNYSPEAIRGIAEKGATQRVEVVNDLAAGLGGTIEGFYYAWGEADGYVIADFPDEASAAALSLVVNSSGRVQLSTTRLITPEEMDKAAQKSGTINYKPPGS